MVGNPAGYSITLDPQRLLIRDYTIAPGALGPWEGCWVRNEGEPERPVVLLVPAEEAALLKTGPPASPGGLTWLLSIVARSEGETAGVELATAESGAEGRDPNDVERPPAEPGRSLIVSLSAPSAQGRGPRALLRDVRARAVEITEWRLEVSSPRGPVELSWDRAADDRAPGLELPLRSLILDDEGSQNAWDLRAAGSARIPPGRHSLRVVASRTPGAPVSPDPWAYAWPNPFQGETTLHYSVPASGRVALQVFDVTGRQIWRQLFHAVPGENACMWDGRDEIGTAAPAGTYFIRLEVESDDGAGKPRRQLAAHKMTLLR